MRVKFKVTCKQEYQRNIQQQIQFGSTSHWRKCVIIFNLLTFILIIIKCGPQVLSFCTNISVIQRGPNFHFNAELRIKFHTICKICIFWVTKQQTRNFVILIIPVTGEKMIVVCGVNKTPPIRLKVSDWISCSLCFHYHGCCCCKVSFHSLVSLKPECFSHENYE